MGQRRVHGTYMQNYWPELNVTGKGSDQDNMDLLNISTDFSSFLTGDGLENTCFFYGGYRVNQNLSSALSTDLGAVLNVSAMNVSYQSQIYLNQSQLDERDLQNIELLQSCPGSLFVCKEAAEAATAEAEGKGVKSLDGVDITDLIYAACVFFTFVFSIYPVLDCLGNTFEARYDDPPDDFEY